MPNKFQDISISFIIPVLNCEKYISQCLEHINREKHHKDEVIVVDNGSVDDTTAMVKEFGDVKILHFPQVTIAAVRNRGASASSAELLAFIDGDVLICNNWRRNVLSVMSDFEIAATGSLCDIPESALWIEKAWYSQRSSEIQRVNYINSGNLIVRRESFESISGFDETLITDEDCDLGLRLNRENMIVLSAPQIRAIHMGNPKTLGHFYGKQKWRATSSLKTQTWDRPDKPTIMTILFMIGLLLTICSPILVTLVGVSLWWLVPITPLVLLVTVLFRIVQYKNPRYFFQLCVLYAIFYSARAVIIIDALLQVIFGKSPR